MPISTNASGSGTGVYEDCIDANLRYAHPASNPVMSNVIVSTSLPSSKPENVCSLMTPLAISPVAGLTRYLSVVAAVVASPAVPAQLRPAIADDLPIREFLRGCIGIGDRDDRIRAWIIAKTGVQNIEIAPLGVVDVNRHAGGGLDALQIQQNGIRAVRAVGADGTQGKAVDRPEVQ